MRFSISLKAAATALLAAQSSVAITLDTADPNSVKAAAKKVSETMMNVFYPGLKNPAMVGLLEPPLYWWQAGAMFGSLVDYWRFTGDTQWVNATTDALLKQVGEYVNYMPQEQAKSLGNDDQAFWGIAAMAAAEYNFPNPPADKPQWLALAQAVFNSQAPRWENATCGGGLRWQIFTFNNGYNYKNTISNGCFFNLAARLHSYTGNNTYLEWARRTWDWEVAIGLISPKYEYFDGSDTLKNCSEMNHLQWSYNPAIHLHGLAVLWNKTEDAFWRTNLENTWKAMTPFFTTGVSSPNTASIATEATCEIGGNCNNDQLSFKAYLARWLSATLKLTPTLPLSSEIRDHLFVSAKAAALSCTGGGDNQFCGMLWNTSVWDGTQGVGQQMSALEFIQGTLIDTVGPPYTNVSGGTSTGDYAAGTGGDRNPLAPARAITTADRAGAGIITLMIIVGLLGGAWWMIA